MSIEDPTFEEFRLLAVLKSVCDQYLGTPDGTGISHSCMSAGESAVSLFEKYGVMQNVGWGGLWVERGVELDSFEDISPSNFEKLREKFFKASGTKLLQMRGDGNPRIPDVNFQGLMLWFTGRAIEQGFKRPSYLPELEPDRLDVAVRQVFVDGSFYLSGELLTLRDLESFRDELVEMQEKGSGHAALRGSRNTVTVEISKIRPELFECSLGLHHPQFKQTTQNIASFDKAILIERLISQLDHSLSKFESGGAQISESAS